MTVRIQPSILSADFVNLERDFGSIGNADGIHVDVMDGHFVPNLTFGLPMVKRMQQVTKLPLDCHLMIENPDHWASKYAELGVFSVTVHYEACKDPKEVANNIRSNGSRAGISIKPNTPVSAIANLVHLFDQVLIMSVEPGFGGQAFIPDSFNKVRQVSEILDGSKTWIQVDGGVDLSNIEELASLGADTFVAGSAVFRELDRAKAIEDLRDAALKGEAERK